MDNIEKTVEPAIIAEESAKYTKAQKKGGNRIGFNYIILKSLKESKKNDVVKCLYIKGITNFGFCVIKEGTYGDSKDKNGRDIKSRLLWQQQLHKKLQNKVRMPKLLGSFEENGNYYLVMEHLSGVPLYKACKGQHDSWAQLETGSKKARRYLHYILQIIELLQNLHANFVVHRDVTANNFMIMPFGRMAIIDMELSYSLDSQYPSPPFQLGTHGHMSPEQEATMTPTVKEDIYALGAVMLQLLTGISPSKSTGGSDTGMLRKVNYLVRDKQMADIIYRCFKTDPLLRPSLAEIKEVVQEYLIVMKQRGHRPASKRQLFSEEEIRESVQCGINALSTPVFCDPEKGWFAEHMQPENNDRNKLQKAWYASYNRGTAGIIYFLGRAKKAGFDAEVNRKAIDLGLSLIETRYADRENNRPPGLHFGSDGIAASLADAISHGLIEETPALREWIATFLEGKTNRPGIMSGMAGQGIANIISSSILSENEWQPKLHHYVAILLNTQQADGTWTEKNKERTIKGFGNGMAGIIYFLLEYARIFKDQQAQHSAFKGLTWLIKTAVKKKEAHWLSASGKELGNWWCEGTSGIALAFIKAYQSFPEPDFLKHAGEALRHLPKEMLFNDLSQGYGLSGLGEVYLEAYKVFKDDEWLQRSANIVQALMHLKREHPSYGPFWLIQHERQPVANMMVGNSGILHFLMRSLQPDLYGPPLMP